VLLLLLLSIRQGLSSDYVTAAEVERTVTVVAVGLVLPGLYFFHRTVCSWHYMAIPRYFK
jgi:hypothetical protein